MVYVDRRNGVELKPRMRQLIIDIAIAMQCYIGF